MERATATIKSKTRLLRVDSPVRVTLDGVDDSTPHLALFRLDPASGLREQSSAAEGTRQTDAATGAGADAASRSEGDGRPAAGDVEAESGRTARPPSPEAGDGATAQEPPPAPGDADRD